MIDILDLAGLTTASRLIDPIERICYLKAKLTRKLPPCKQMTCPECGVVGKLYKHGKRKSSTFLDIPIREYKVQISFNLQRLRCFSCHAMFVQDAPSMDLVHKMTRRCVRWIRGRSLLDTHAYIAQQVGCDEGTVQRIAYDYIAQLNYEHVPEMPQHLGIDEIALHGHYRCVLTDVRAHRVIDLLPDREEKTVKQWLLDHHSPDLQVVTIDMWKDYKNALRRAFPKLQIPIVIDKFHVLRMANRAVDDVRIKLSKGLNEKQRQWWTNNKGLLRARNYRLPKKGKARQKLTPWLASNPDLATAYELKETFLKIYGLRSRGKAEAALDQWRESVQAQPERIREHFDELIKATKNWQTEILAYFQHLGVTNAFTESMNSVIRVADRRGRGYDFEVLRARVLFSRRPKYSRKSVKGLELLAKTPGIPKWLRSHLKHRLRKDTQGMEEGYTSHEISSQHKLLARKYGDLCAGCGGQLQAKLLEFRQSLPGVERHLANTEFWGLICRECGKEFDAYSPNPPLRFQPGDPGTR
jgi:transposase